AAPWRLRTAARLSPWFGWLLRSGPVQRWLKGGIRSGPPGPSDEQRARGRSLLWGEACDAAGRGGVSRGGGPRGGTPAAGGAGARRRAGARRAGGAGLPNAVAPARPRLRVGTPGGDAHRRGVRCQLGPCPARPLMRLELRPRLLDLWSHGRGQLGAMVVEKA